MDENFKRRLVPTDFSESGDHAIGHAFRMAADHGAEVVRCHIVEMIVAPNPLSAQYYPADLMSPEIQQRAEREAIAALRERVPWCAEATSCRAATRVVGRRCLSRRSGRWFPPNAGHMVPSTTSRNGAEAKTS